MPDPTPYLTPRQRLVLDGLARGETYAQTAARLRVSEAAVHGALRMAYARLGARNGPHAVHIAHCCGLLDGKAVGTSHQPAATGNVATSTGKGSR